MKYMVEHGWNDGSAKDSAIYTTEQEAREAYDAIDIAGRYVTEWLCLPVGGRERHARRRAEKEITPVEIDESGSIEGCHDSIEYDSYGFEEFRRDEEGRASWRDGGR